MFSVFFRLKLGGTNAGFHSLIWGMKSQTELATNKMSKCLEGYPQALKNTCIDRGIIFYLVYIFCTISPIP